MITNNVLKIARECIPNKTITVRSNAPAWLNNAVRKLIRKRKYYHRKAKNSGKEDDWAKFRQYRNICTNAIRNSKRKYLDKLCDKLNSSNNTSTKEWWKIINTFMSNSKRKSDIPPISVNNDILYDDLDKANSFNTFFSSQSTINDSNIDPPVMTRSHNHILTDIVISRQDVLDSIHSLNTKKASGPDLISPRMIKEAAYILSYPLHILFNISLAACTYPSTWKTANVTPVFKKDDPSILSNYRPISLLSIVGKLMERCVYKYVYNYLTDNSLLTPFQSGFRSGDSTINQLASISNDIVSALDKGKEVRMVFCDISKAFDRVWHRGLLSKLKSFGITGNLLSWFSDYLHNRCQRVVINGKQSDLVFISAGVPQGSILGPLLFLIYINDIVNDINCTIKLFADDTSLYVEVDSPGLTANLINDNLSKIHEWSKKWLVNFNPTKTVTMTVSKKLHKPIHPSLLMNNTSLTEVTCHKHLGVSFSSNGSWTDHIQYIIGKSSKKLSLLRNLKFIIDRKSLQTIYYTFIRPLLEYGDIVWDNITLGQSQMLENIQLEAARIVTGATKLTSHDRLYIETSWDPLVVRRRKHKIIHFHKIVHGHCPSYLTNILPARHLNIHTHNTRRANDFCRVNCRTNLYKDSFLPSSVNLWNSLPDNIKHSPSINNLKAFLNTDTHSVPKHYYYCNNRQGQIHHTRLRMNCSSLNDHLFRRNLIDSPLCPCKLSSETTEHFLLHCPIYQQLRYQCFNHLPPYYMYNSNILLYGCQEIPDHMNEIIFDCVQNFICQSRRF